MATAPHKCTNLACRYYGQTVCRCYPWMQEKASSCYHGVPLSRDCDKCAESYGDARPTHL